METNLILDKLPNSIQTENGSLFVINTDFRVGIQVELCMNDPQLTSEQKAERLLYLYFGDLPAYELFNHFEELIQYALYFYSGGKKRRKRSTEDKSNKMIYSFEYDDNLIWAAFWDRGKGINLRTIPYMHWWDFQAALWTLPLDCAFMKAVEIRSIDLTQFKGEERAHYTKLQQDYAFPEAKSVEQKINRLEEILMGSGDIDGEGGLNG